MPLVPSRRTTRRASAGAASPRTVPLGALATVLATVLAAVLATGACGTADAPAASSGGTDAAASVLTITDPWVKAVDAGMTGVFATLVNDGDTDVTVTGATSDAAATAELHETTVAEDGAMVMKEVASFVVPAGGERVLAPGGDHVMLLGVDDPIEPGEEVEVVLTTADGGTVTMTASARTFAGANEPYHDDGADADTDATGTDGPAVDSPDAADEGTQPSS